MHRREQFIRGYYGILENMIRPLAIRGVTPNIVSLISLVLSLISALLYGTGYFFTGGLLLLLSGFTDTLDGTIARITGLSSRFGALLDSTLDRYAEFFVFAGLLIHFRNDWTCYAVIMALMGSIMVSYVKARAESLGSTRVIGLMQRPERLVMLALGSLLNTPLGMYLPAHPDCIMKTTLVILAVLTNITAIHRLMAERRDLSREQ